MCFFITRINNYLKFEVVMSINDIWQIYAEAIMFYIYMIYIYIYHVYKYLFFSFGDKITSIANITVLWTIFRIEGNDNFQLEVSENKDVIFFPYKFSELYP